MRDQFALEAAAQAADPAIREILNEVCRLTGMGFAAVARVTDQRWIAAQVVDKIEFGLDPGDELELKTTICDEIRQHGNAVVIDHVGGDPAWRSHPTPMLYGFQSYVSIPIVLADGSFFGTLCAIDPEPRVLSSDALIATLTGFAQRVAEVLAPPAPSFASPPVAAGVASSPPL